MSTPKEPVVRAFRYRPQKPITLVSKADSQGLIVLTPFSSKKGQVTFVRELQLDGPLKSRTFTPRGDGMFVVDLYGLTATAPSTQAEGQSAPPMGTQAAGTQAAATTSSPTDTQLAALINGALGSNLPDPPVVVKGYEQR